MIPAKVGRVLGALIHDPVPIRLANVAEDPRASGLPPHHPPITSFLGVPVRAQNEVFGNLYLGESERGAFTAEDEDLIVTLAATASIAIENARLYEESRQRQEWRRASAEISRDLQAADCDLQRIADSVRRLGDADLVAMVPVTEDDELEVLAASGPAEDRLRGLKYGSAGSAVWKANEDRHSTPLDPGSAEHAPLLACLGVAIGPLMAFSFVGETSARGAMVVGREPDGAHFFRADVNMAEAFASQAAVALEICDARAYSERIAVLEDRDRIARDLHDHVINGSLPPV